MQKITHENLILAMIHGLTGTLLLWSAIYLYRSHPYYQGFLNTGITANWGIIFLVLVGILWGDAVWKVLKLRSGGDGGEFPQTDMLILYFWVLRIARERKISMQPETKRALLYLVLKLFFLPIMANIVVSNAQSLLVTFQNVQTGRLEMSYQLLYQVWFNFIFLIDGSVFGFGYLFASTSLGSKLKSVDPTALGWVAALSTYPPFNSATGTLLPMLKQPFPVLSAAWPILRALEILILISHTLFVVASLNLGTRASNLTSRGTVSWGLYSYIRHPAYTFKLTAWLVEGIIYAGNLAYFMAWVAFAGIYALRAWTEERHLASTDPEYVEYQQKVKWRFIPRLV